MNDHELQEKLAAMRAGADQAREAGKELAASIAAYFHELVGLGLERGEALQLTIGFQTMVLGMAFQAAAGGEGQ